MIDSLRKLARSYKYQFLYSRAKEMGSIHLFDNETDLSRIQINFLQWLEIYNMLYQDLRTGEDFITEEVIEDDLRTDAYLLFKEKIKNKKKRKQGQREVDRSEASTSILFKRK